MSCCGNRVTVIRADRAALSQRPTPIKPKSTARLFIKNSTVIHPAPNDREQNRV